MTIVGHDHIGITGRHQGPVPLVSPAPDHVPVIAPRWCGSCPFGLSRRDRILSRRDRYAKQPSPFWIQSNTVRIVTVSLKEDLCFGSSLKFLSCYELRLTAANSTFPVFQRKTWTMHALQNASSVNCTVALRGLQNVIVALLLQGMATVTVTWMSHCNHDPDADESRQELQDSCPTHNPGPAHMLMTHCGTVTVVTSSHDRDSHVDESLQSQTRCWWVTAGTCRAPGHQCLGAQALVKIFRAGSAYWSPYLRRTRWAQCHRALERAPSPVWPPAKHNDATICAHI